MEQSVSEWGRVSALFPVASLTSVTGISVATPTPPKAPGTTGALDHQDLSQGGFRTEIAALVNTVLDLKARVEKLEQAT